MVEIWQHPLGVDPDGVSASFHQGVLEIRIPKPDRVKPRRVEIAVGSGPRTIESQEGGSES